MKLRPSLPLVIALAATLGCALLGGCGQSGEPDAGNQAENVQTAQSMRAIFDKSGGDFESLNDVDKAAYIKLSGGEEKATRNWDLMKNGPGAADRTGAGQ